MNGDMMMPGEPRDAAGRLAAHAAALQPGNPIGRAASHSGQMFAHQNSQASDMSNWAADFARFSGGGPQPGMQQQQQPLHQAHHQQATQGNFHAAFPYQHGGFAPRFGPTNGGFLDPAEAAINRPAQEAEFEEEMSRWMAANGDSARNARAMEDVDAVMEQLAQELEITEQHQQQHQQFMQDPDANYITVNTSPSKLTDLEHSELGNLHSAAAEDQNQVRDAKGRSEVSEAAERLLDSVKHEDGDKWKNSIFLRLMRDFRDGKKDIEGDQILETDGASSGKSDSSSDKN